MVHPISDTLRPLPSLSSTQVTRIPKSLLKDELVGFLHFFPAPYRVRYYTYDIFARLLIP
jgi:hypothetical protein